MTLRIVAERPDSADAITLIEELEGILAPLYAVESRHGYSVEKLLRTGVEFFVLRYETVPAGCGGVQCFGTDYAELKRMYVRPAYRGLGFGKLIVNHLADHCLHKGISRLRLETGIYQTAAIHLYESMGFTPIPPFGDYREDPVSLFYEKHLDSTASTRALDSSH